MRKKRKLSFKTLILLLFVIIIVCFGIIEGLTIINKHISKKNYIAESNHNTANDDRKLVTYKNFTMLENLTNTKLEYTKLFKEFDEFITEDLQYIYDGDGTQEFFLDNHERFFKDYILEYSSFEKLYKQIHKKNINYLTEYESCSFIEDGDKIVAFEITYENNFKINGSLFFNDEDQKIYLVF